VLCEDAAAARAVPPPLGIHVDVNPGMHRTGIGLGDLAAIREVARQAGPRFRGIHCYDGHLHGPDAAGRRAAAFACYDELVQRIEALLRDGLEVPEAITCGTPTFQLAATHPGLAALRGTRHRVSPGTVVYHDTRTEEELPDLPLVPAVVVLARVVSHPRDGIATCDAGSKTLAVDAGDPCALALGHPGLVAQKASEEHLPFRVERGERPPRGAALWLVPRHVCPTVNLADDALLVERGEPRGIVRVAARGHELCWVDPR